MTWVLNLFKLSFFLRKIRVIIKAHRLSDGISKLIFMDKLVT